MCLELGLHCEVLDYCRQKVDSETMCLSRCSRGRSAFTASHTKVFQVKTLRSSREGICIFGHGHRVWPWDFKRRLVSSRGRQRCRRPQSPCIALSRWRACQPTGLQASASTRPKAEQPGTQGVWEELRRATPEFEVLHPALRAPRSASIPLDGQNVVPEASSSLNGIHDSMLT